ncbi:hypothetical protein [Albirhodobacter sp. R86504]|jgi:hypothetical protein|uniref:hypothetical protein n=1 Tax=Albirhodobacter sp. R86504 TaxID=3093848 RepID=UPI00366EDE41
MSNTAPTADYAITGDADTQTAANHDSPAADNHTMLVALVFLGWVTTMVAAFAAFGLGGLITVATLTAWAVLALIVVMTAGG